MSIFNKAIMQQKSHIEIYIAVLNSFFVLLFLSQIIDLKGSFVFAPYLSLIGGIFPLHYVLLNGVLCGIITDCLSCNKFLGFSTIVYTLTVLIFFKKNKTIRNDSLIFLSIKFGIFHTCCRILAFLLCGIFGHQKISSLNIKLLFLFSTQDCIISFFLFAIPLILLKNINSKPFNNKKQNVRRF